MQNKNPHEKIHKSNVMYAVILYVDQFGGGTCKNCSWVQVRLDRSDDIYWSYNSLM